MKRVQLPLLLATALLAGSVCVEAASIGTAFAYQGKLLSGTNAANGLYDLKFTLYDAASSGNAVGGPITPGLVGATNGLFTVTVDFGPGVFTGEARWLEVSVRTNGGSEFAALAPRQPLTPSPYALFAPTAAVASSVATGAVGTASLQTGSVDSSKIADGTIVAADLSPALALSTFWRLDGNSATTPGTCYLGTADNQPLELKVNSQRAVRLEPNASGAPNVIAGSLVNAAGAGVVGATIGGGGAVSYQGLNWTNRIESDFGTIGGGQRNKIEASAAAATISGGRQNVISTGGTNSVIGGGLQNTIGGDYAAIGGGVGNAIQNNSRCAVIGGGWLNLVQPNAPYALIAGGYGNTNAGSYATVLGGQANLAGGDYSLAAGRRAKASHDGTFVWADSSDADFASSGPNQFLIRASGGVGLGTSSPKQLLDIRGTTGAFVGIDGGTSNLSGVRIAENGADKWILFFRGWESDNLIVRDEVGKLDTVTFESSTGRVGIGTKTPGTALEVADRITAGKVDGTFLNWTPSGGSVSVKGLISSSDPHAGYGVTIGPDHASPVVWMYSQPGNSFEVMGMDYGQAIPDAGKRLMRVEINGDTHVMRNAYAKNFIPESDRNLKTDITPVDVEHILSHVLALPISTWDFTNSPGTRHLGPMAQDFHAAFGLGGDDDKHISTLDADGVALAAIQGLNQKLEQRNAALEKRVEELTALVKSLAEKVNGGAQ